MMFASLSASTLRGVSRPTTTPALNASFCRLARRNYSNDLKAYPQYNIFGESCMLSVKLLPPIFRLIRSSNTLVLDGNKKGRILLEWVQRNPDGTISRDREAIIRFGLSPEEVGLVLHQMPQQQTVEFVRKSNANEAFFEGPGVPQKVCRIAPNSEFSSVDFIIDFEVDGVGGHVLQGAQGPLKVTAQAGEAQVLTEIMRSSLPYLIGWSTTQDIAISKNVADAQSEAGSKGGHDNYGY